MEITWQGLSSTRLVSGDVSLVIDPCPDAPGDVEADILAITNDDPAHSARDRVIGDPKLIDGPGQYEVRGYNITGTGTALADTGAGRKVNTVYVIRAEGLAVCHLGALRARMAARQLGALGAIDVLIAPAGGGRALEPQDVAQMINALSPRIVIPVHYGEEGDEGGLAPLSTLLGHLNVEAPDPQARLSVTQTNLPRETRVVTLQPYAPRRR